MRLRGAAATRRCASRSARVARRRVALGGGTRASACPARAGGCPVALPTSQVIATPTLPPLAWRPCPPQVADRPRIGTLLRDWRAGAASASRTSRSRPASRPATSASSRPAARGRAPRWSSTSPSTSTCRCATATRCCSPPASRPRTPSATSTSRRWGRCARRSTGSCAVTSRTRRVVVDRHWGLVAANRARRRCYRRRRGAPARTARQRPAPQPAPEGMAPRIVNLGEWRAHLLDRLGRQAVVTGDPALPRCTRSSPGYPGGEGGHVPDLEAGAIAVPLRLRTDDGELALHQHRDDVRDGDRRHGVGARDRVVLPGGRRDGRVR